MIRLCVAGAAICALLGCDDTVFPGSGAMYPPGQQGVKQFLDNECALCHPAIEPAYDFPEDVWAAAADDTNDLVVPGDPEASKLWRVISDPGPSDVAMPSAGLLPPGTVQVVYDWILEGAPTDEVAP